MDASRIRIGCAGWSLVREVQDRFPPDGSHLARYARGLSAVEINSSFYRPHRPATYAKWAVEVPEDFRFSVKLPKEISHERQLEDCDELLQQFWGDASHLGEKLGAVLIQLPPSLVFERGIASEFFASWRKLSPAATVCEPRHATWFTAEAEKLLQKFAIGRVAADPAPVPTAATPGGDRRLQYFRLHGSPRMYYSHYEPEYLLQLSQRLQQAAAEGDEVWCIFDNTAAKAAVPNALELAALVGP